MSSPETKNINASFALFFGALEGGALHDDATDLLHATVSELGDAQKDKGGKQRASITMKFDFTMDKDGIVEVCADLKNKLPATNRGRAGMFFITPDGNLSRENPRQRTFDEFTARQEAARERAQAVAP